MTEVLEILSVGGFVVIVPEQVIESDWGQCCHVGIAVLCLIIMVTEDGVWGLNEGGGVTGVGANQGVSLLVTIAKQLVHLHHTLRPRSVYSNL